MSSVASSSSPKPNSGTYVVHGIEWGVIIPYVIAVLAQGPMLWLYYGRLMDQPHYQSVIFAIAATIGVAVMRWPRGRALQFHSSPTSDVLLVGGLVALFFSVLFVEPWMSALSTMLIITSFLARIYDEDSNGSLWYAALPLFVFLALPFDMDQTLVTSLQYYAGNYTTRLLDLVAIPHYMDGVQVHVPNQGQYRIEDACSGVQSFFTLVLVAVVYSVFNRQVKSPHKGVAILSVMFGGLLLAIRFILLRNLGSSFSTFWSTAMLICAIALLLYSIIGFRTTALVLSAVFWALFMNTIRIFAIPVAKTFFDADIAHGLSHTILGYATLLAGIGLILSTDQVLLFLFGPVQDAEDSGGFGRIIGRMWNSLMPGKQDKAATTRKRRQTRKPISPLAQKVLWGFAALVLVAGLWQIRDVRACESRAGDKLAVQVFQGDVTVPFEEADMPKKLGQWNLTDYTIEQRNRGSDFGERSDIWQYRGPRTQAIAALDQTFPGWHELTTCYRNSGWKVKRRRALSPAKALGVDPSEVDDNSWRMIEVTMSKPTGEQAYLLFSHFDSFGQGLQAPQSWGSINGFITRVLNRFSHRIRASLLHGEAYQVQILLNSYSDFDPAVTAEARKQYLKFREEVRTKFLQKVSGSEP